MENETMTVEDPRRCGKRLREIRKTLAGIDGLTDHQVLIDDLGWDASKMVQLLKIRIRPNDGPYFGGQYRFEISLGSDFPAEAPQVSCLDRVFHPNIDPTESESNVCLSVLDEWDSNFGLDDLLQGLLFLFHHPNLEDPLSPYFGGEMDEEEFVECVRRTMQGMALDGCCYARTVIVNDSPSLADTHAKELAFT